MDEWRRVADEALGVREPKVIELRKVRAPELEALPPAIKLAPLPAPRKAVPVLIPSEPIWCGQCDRRVPAAQVAACKSQFCKVKAMAA